MALRVIIPESLIDDSDIDNLTRRFRARSSSNQEHQEGTVYNFSNSGESKFSPEALAIADSKVGVDGKKIRLEDGMFYHIFTDTLKDNLVPVDWPESKDSSGERISYENYFRKDTQYALGGGTWLFRICRGTQGLSDEHRKIYQDTLCGGEGEPAQFLVKSEGVELIPAPEEL